MPTGPGAAALISAGLGLLAMAISHVAAEVSVSFKGAMQALGNSWIPGAPGIGPYAGKETVGLLVWLLSWAILHVLLRRRQVSVVAAGVASLLLIGVATTLLWPPVTHLFVPASR
jgi:hypothetical protein